MVRVYFAYVSGMPRVRILSARTLRLFVQQVNVQRISEVETNVSMSIICPP